MEEINEGKKKRKPKPELIKLGQGKRLAQFRLKFKNRYNSRQAFAEDIGTSETTILEIENNYRRIKGKVEALLCNKFSDAEVDWILTGKSTELLTVIEKEKVNYNCKECLKKDAEYKELNEKYRKLLEDYNDCLKQLAGIKKASSE
jgi:DNA-binding XRE family transcriptional regulator